MPKLLAFSLSVVLALALSTPAVADWVTLADGGRVRGINLRKQGDGYLFTVETGKTVYIRAANFVSVEKSPPEEKVPFRDREVKLEEMIRTLEREHKAHEVSQARAMEKWARGGQPGEAARAEITALPPEEQEACFGRALVKGTSKLTRKLAARELGAFPTAHAARALAAAAVLDPSEGVRKESVKALAALSVPRKGESFLPFLLSGKSDERLRASEALRSFPTYQAVPPLVLAVHKSWNGGQRSVFFKGEQRAYVSDYELVSGGTGFSIVEVADPVIRTTGSGVVLDVEVAHSEETFHLATLTKITGRSFGKDLALWQRWWKETGEALAAAEKAPPGEASPPPASPVSPPSSSN